MKRSQGRKKGPKNFRKRFFSLTSDGFTYHKGKGESPLCFIPSDELLAVERLDENAFSLKFVSLIMTVSTESNPVLLPIYQVIAITQLHLIVDVSAYSANKDTVHASKEQC